jgi:hypothetical protein
MTAIGRTLRGRTCFSIWITRPSKPSRRARPDELTGLAFALGPDLTGRVHLAYRRTADRRWWRRRYPGRTVPEWDFFSLCGRRGLVEAEGWRRFDCQSCARILGNRRYRLATEAGAAT